MLKEIFKLSNFQKFSLALVIFIIALVFTVFIAFVLVIMQFISSKDFATLTTSIIPTIIGVIGVTIYIYLLILPIIFIIKDTFRLKRKSIKHDVNFTDIFRLISIVFIIFSLIIAIYHTSLEARLFFNNLVWNYEINNCKVSKCENLSNYKDENYEVEISIPAYNSVHTFTGKDIKKLYELCLNNKQLHLKLFIFDDKKYIYSIENYLLYDNHKLPVLKSFLPFSWIYLFLILLIMLTFGWILLIIRLFIYKLPLEAYSELNILE